MFGTKMRQLLYVDSGESRESRPGPLASAVRSTLNFLTNPFRAAAQSTAAPQQQRRNQVNHICMEIPTRIILTRCPGSTRLAEKKNIFIIRRSKHETATTFS